MTYSLTTNMAQAVSELSQIFPLKTACEMIQSLKEQGCQAVRLDIKNDNDISTGIWITGIKDYFTYTNGRDPIE